MSNAPQTKLENEQKVEKKRKLFKFESPHPFALLFYITIAITILTYFIPGGEFDRVTNSDGQTVVVEGTYHEVEKNLSGFFDVFQSIFAGMVSGAEIIFFIFIVGGAFNIFSRTNAIEAAFGSLSEKLANKEVYLIPVLMLFFGILGGSIGMFEETLPFILILVPLMIKIGFDSITGIAVILVSISTGFMAAFINPFTIGVAQGIAEVPIFSGMGTRFVFWIIFMCISIAYVMIYANKIKKHPEKSPMYLEDKQRDNVTTTQPIFTARHGLILSVLGLLIVVLAIGVMKYDWYLQEISAAFLIMGLVVGFIDRKRVNQMFDDFTKGCQDLVLGSLVIGFAYGAIYTLENSNTIDTILNTFSSLLTGSTPVVAAIGMFITQSFMNLIITGGAGQAAITMPIMAPLGDLAGVSRQTAVLAFQMGDGLTNIITPTSGILLAALAMAKIPWIKWAKWILPLILIHFTVAAILVVIAHLFIWTV